MEPNNIAETLRNYAKLPDTSPMLKCVLAEAAATIESLQSENDHYVEMVAKLVIGEEQKCE